MGPLINSLQKYTSTLMLKAWFFTVKFFDYLFTKQLKLVNKIVKFKYKYKYIL